MSEVKETETLQEKRYLKETKEIIQIQIKEDEKRLNELNQRKSINSNDQEVNESLKQKVNKELRHLSKALDTPYFARIDFLEKNDNEINQKVYIGKCSVIKENMEMQVVDWRTPIAGLYYDGRLGDVSYESPSGIVEGNLSLKRVYDIENGEMVSYSDVDVTTSDELLKPYLSASSDNRLKNIIATIQKEQNEIIRAKMTKPLIVQGVAGSGKTTVALHRIAYLAYNKEVNPEGFLIIAPNKFFLDYISTILPDLGVDDVSQLTFEEFAKKVIGKDIKIENSNSKLADIVNNGRSEDDIVQKVSTYKSSLDYKKAIDRFLEENNFCYLPTEDLKIEDIVILSKEKLLETFNNQYHKAETPIKDQFKMFVRRLGTFIEQNADKIEMLIKNMRQNEINQIDSSLSDDEKKSQKNEIFKKYDLLLKKLDNRGKKLLDEYSKKAGKKSALEIYKEFISQLDYSDNNKEIIQCIQEKMFQKNNNKEVEYEDLAPLMYIQQKIKGSTFSKRATHIIIDEAQDYSEFQLAALKEILQNDSITILGDIAQGIYSYRGITDWNKVNRDIFGDSAEIIELGKSYRTTMEIMEKGNDVISKIKDKIKVKFGEPVIRKGKPVTIEKKENNHLVENIAGRIEELQSENRENIAVITKTLQEAIELHKKLLKNNMSINLISEKATEYKGGISIMPSYLSKGLEFDSVIISDASKELYGNNELDAKLLYIAITRAMHTLDIYYTRERSDLLTERKRNNKGNKNIIDLDDECR